MSYQNIVQLENQLCYDVVCLAYIFVVHVEYQAIFIVVGACVDHEVHELLIKEEFGVGKLLHKQVALPVKRDCWG